VRRRKAALACVLTGLAGQDQNGAIAGLGPVSALNWLQRQAAFTAVRQTVQAQRAVSIAPRDFVRHTPHSLPPRATRGEGHGHGPPIASVGIPNVAINQPHDISVRLCHRFQQRKGRGSLKSAMRFMSVSFRVEDKAQPVSKHQGTCCVDVRQGGDNQRYSDNPRLWSAQPGSWGAVHVPSRGARRVRGRAKPVWRVCDQLQPAGLTRHQVTCDGKIEAKPGLVARVARCHGRQPVKELLHE